MWGSQVRRNTVSAGHGLESSPATGVDGNGRHTRFTPWLDAASFSAWADTLPGATFGCGEEANGQLGAGNDALCGKGFNRAWRIGEYSRVPCRPAVWLRRNAEEEASTSAGRAASHREGSQPLPQPGRNSGAPSVGSHDLFEALLMHTRQSPSQLPVPGSWSALECPCSEPCV